MLRKVLGTAKNPTWENLRPNWEGSWPNWEGSYRITSVAGMGAYYLKDLDENVVQRP